MPAPAIADEALPLDARVLIVRLSALGDVLFALETVASLRAERPDVRIEFLVEDRFASILDGHPQLDAVRTLPRRGWSGYLRALLALRRARYDVVLDVHGLLKSAIPVIACRARRRIGFTPPGAREWAHLIYQQRVELPLPLPHRADRGLFLLRALGLRGERAGVELGAPSSPVGFWGDTPRPRVVLHPGTSAFAAFKRWPVASYLELGQRLAAEGVQIAVSHGPGEAALAREVGDRVARARVVDGGAIGLVGLAAVFRDADVVVAADTGPLHVATAAGAPVVALFGPKDTASYGPRGAADRQRVLLHDVPCRPCKRRSCASPQCVLGVSVDRVAAAVRELLSATRP